MRFPRLFGRVSPKWAIAAVAATALVAGGLAVAIFATGSENSDTGQVARPSLVNTDRAVLGDLTPSPASRSRTPTASERLKATPVFAPLPTLHSLPTLGPLPTLPRLPVLPTLPPFPTLPPIPTLQPFPTFPPFPTLPPLPTLPPFSTLPPVDTVVQSCIDGEFTGWSGDTLFELCNGQLWVQSSYAYTYHYAYRPEVTIVRDGGGYQMFVEGISGSVSVEQITDFVRTCIDGDFEGWEGDTVFSLCNGQVWQQVSYAYTYHYAYRPAVLIYRTDFGYKMKVEGVDKTITVTRLK